MLCPASGRYVWEEQVRLWSPYKATIVWRPEHLRGDGVKILTYGLVSNDTKGLVDAVASGQPFDVGVLDEAAALKNPAANRTKAVLKRMLGRLGYALPLSGTPAPNHAGELYPILQALYPQALVNGSGGILTQWQFEDRYCNVRLQKFGQGRPIRVIEGSRNLAELRQKISPFMLRIRKEMVLKDLPPVRYDIVPIGVDPLASANLPTMPDFDSDEAVLRYLAGGGHSEPIMKLRRMLGVLKVNPACEYLDDFMQALPAHRKVLVFAHHREVIASLMHGLKDHHPVQASTAAPPPPTGPRRSIRSSPIRAAGCSSATSLPPAPASPWWGRPVIAPTCSLSRHLTASATTCRPPPGSTASASMKQWSPGF